MAVQGDDVISPRGGGDREGSVNVAEVGGFKDHVRCSTATSSCRGHCDGLVHMEVSIIHLVKKIMQIYVVSTIMGLGML